MTKTSIEMNNKTSNDLKASQTIIEFQQKVEKARKDAVTFRDSEVDYDFMTDDHFDEIHWEFSLEYREHVAKAVSHSDGIHLTMKSIGNKTELISSIRFGNIETVIYQVEVPTIKLSQYSLATNGCIQYYDGLEDPIYVS